MSDPLALALVVTAFTWLLSQLGMSRQAYLVCVVVALIAVVVLVLKHFGAL
jgi:hypothetical protein